MSSRLEFATLNTSQKFLLAGHLTTALGFLFISIGTTIRLLEMGDLPIGQPFPLPNAGGNGDRPSNANTARNYFS